MDTMVLIAGALAAWSGLTVWVVCLCRAAAAGDRVKVQRGQR